MIIKRSINYDGNIAPEVYNLLNHLPDETLHNIDYRKGHPLAIYNESLSRISKSFTKVLDLYEKHDSFNEFPTSDFLELLEEQKELLHSLHSHFDDCYQILKVTSPYPNVKEIPQKQIKNLERSTYSWLNRFRHPGIKYFADNTEYYRTFLGKIVNKIKHEQARLRGISIKMDQQQYLGYYVEVIGLNKENIAKLPDPKIHPGGTAFSFSRDLSFHFYNIYAISHYLKKSLEQSFKQLYGIKVEHKKIEIEYLDFEDISRRISNLSLEFFLDEYSKPHPLVFYIDKNNSKELTLKMDNPWYKSYIPNVIQVYWLYEHDGATEYCAMPYFDYCLKYLPMKSLPELL